MQSTKGVIPQTDSLPHL